MSDSKEAFCLGRRWGGLLNLSSLAVGRPLPLQFCELRLSFLALLSFSLSTEGDTVGSLGIGGFGKGGGSAACRVELKLLLSLLCGAERSVVRGEVWGNTERVYGMGGWIRSDAIASHWSWCVLC